VWAWIQNEASDSICFLGAQSPLIRDPPRSGYRVRTESVTSLLGLQGFAITRVEQKNIFFACLARARGRVSPCRWHHGDGHL